MPSKKSKVKQQQTGNAWACGVHKNQRNCDCCSPDEGPILNSRNTPKTEVKRTPPPLHYLLIITVMVAIFSMIISPQVKDKLISLDFDDVNLPPSVRLTIIRAGYQDDMNGTIFDKRFIDRETFNSWISNKGRFFSPSNGIQINSWKQLNDWISENEKNNNNNQKNKKERESMMTDSQSPLIYFDPGLKRKHHDDHEDIELRSGDGGVPFVWPPLKIGHKVVRKDMTSPCGLEKPITIETMNTSPKIFYVHNFMNHQEADALIAFAQDPSNPYSLRPSTTGHKSWTQGGEKNTMSKRTSLNGFDISSPTSHAVKARAFDLLKIEPYFDGMADGIQVLRYQQSQAYIPHSDYFKYKTSPDHNWDPRIGGTNRFATVLLFLSDVEEGGETVFPNVDRLDSMTKYNDNEIDNIINQMNQMNHSQSQINHQNHTKNNNDIIKNGTWEYEMVKQCRTKFSVKPRKGDALLFYSQLPDGTLDERSLHGGCPVLSGAKWAANVWVWNGCRYSVCKNLPP